MDNRTLILEVKHLSKYFYQGKTPMKAVDDVSFHVFKGETFGLVGESGCGKTTTGRTVIRLYKPTSGEVWFNGKRIDGKLNKEETKAVTSKMQMIFQDPVASLNPRMTVEEIISEGARINHVFNSKEELKANVRKMLELVGLTSEHATRHPHEFSGGQRQRICIARALITKPDLSIADEAQVLNLLNDLRKELGLTILFVAHDLSVVKYFSERIAVMNKGHIVEMASSSQLYENPVHPYTKSLLSAIPIPNPLVEKKRERFDYDPSVHGYNEQNMPKMIEVEPGHHVFMSDLEYKRYLETK